jgi:FkbM family methyltransferase
MFAGRVGGALRKMRARVDHGRLRKLVDGSTHTLTKLGSQYGGWYVPSAMLGAQSVCYCVGAGEDITFDVSLAHFGCRVFTFDPTPRAKAHALMQNDLRAADIKFCSNTRDLPQIRDGQQNGVIHFIELGIWSASGAVRFFAPQDPRHVSHSIVNLQGTGEYIEIECTTLKEAMSALGHDEIALLKIDVEGAEYEIIRSMLRDRIRPGILCLELDEGFHHLDRNYFTRMKGLIDCLKQEGYACARIDHWNCTFVLR